MRLLTASSSTVLVALCTLLAAGCGGTGDSDNVSDPSMQGDNLGAGAGAPGSEDATTDGGAGGGTDKVTICHIPPGNPANAHTITVGAPAVWAHLRHGDTQGPCGGDAQDAGTPADGGVSEEPDAGGGGGEDGGVSEPDAGTGEGDVDAGPACFPSGSDCSSEGPNPCCNGLSCIEGLCQPVIG